MMMIMITTGKMMGMKIMGMIMNRMRMMLRMMSMGMVMV